MPRVEIRQGRNIEVQTSFSPNASCTLFFIHGSMASHIQFTQLCHFLRKAHAPAEFNFVMFDALGCGESDKPIDSGEGESIYGVDNLYLDAREVISRYSTVGLKSVIIGHSFGTSLTARLVSCPELVKQCNICASVLLGTTRHVPDGGRTGYLFMLPTFLLSWMQSSLSEQFLQAAFSSSTSESIKDESRRYSNRNEMHVCKSFYNNFQWANSAHWDALNINTPVLIVQGDDDKITPMVGAKELFVQHFSTSGDNDCRNRFVAVPKAGHQLMQEQPEEIATELLQFLKDIGVLPTS